MKKTDTTRILVADDQQDVLEALRLLLKEEGYAIDQATSPRAVLEAIKSRDYDALLIDLNYTRDTTSGREGLDLLSQLRALDSTLPVVVMTAWGSVEVAVEAMRRGAHDFVQKPWDSARLLLVAQALHAASHRATLPLVIVNAGGFSEGVFESELFGHVKGAYTDARADRVGRFELADGGTLFLDEIANVPPGLQAKLLRVLETGEFERVGSSRTRKVDARILSATNADIRAEVAAGRFRQDLLFRLNTIEIHVPPLRERREDVPVLARHFLSQHTVRYRKILRDFDDDARKALLEHRWPGNVRELDHAVERAGPDEPGAAGARH